jgi:hypothetical protein
MKPMHPIVALFRALFAAIAVLAAAGCTYRFTNEHIHRPEGIRSIAIEAVWDTSREAIPHELLWEALQSAFAADGHLRLAAQSSADALLRAHVSKAIVDPAGSPILNGPASDPPGFGNGPPEPANPTYALDKLRILRQAGNIYTSAHVGATVEIEVWSLRTRTLLMKHTYPISGAFTVVRDPVVTPPANDYLRYEEATDATFKTLSQNLAQQVVKDLIIQ